MHRHYTRTNRNLRQSCLFKFYVPSNCRVFFLFEFILLHFLRCVGLQQQITPDNGDIIIIIIIDDCLRVYRLLRYARDNVFVKVGWNNVPVEGEGKKLTIRDGSVPIN